MHKFVKLRNEEFDIDYPWMLFCDNQETMRDHALTYLKPVISDGMSDMIEHITKGYHFSTTWGYAMSVLEKRTILESSVELELLLHTTKLEMIEGEGAIYLTDGPSYMPYSTDLVETEVLMKDSIAFPHYSQSDIQIKQWPGGNHYYASVGNMDVVIDGESKWNTPEQAKRMAVKYFKEL